ncbi:hypothetical protein NFI96_012220, partial [Prochilodus magdalenae]
YNSNHIIGFADDTTVVGLNGNNNDSAYREEVNQLIACTKFLEVHISDDLTWTTHATSLCQEGTAAPSLSMKDENSKPSPSHPHNILQGNNREHPDQQPHSLVWQLHSHHSQTRNHSRQ